MNPIEDQTIDPYNPDEPILDYVRRHVEVIPFSGCWIWTRCTDEKGYAKLGRQRVARLLLGLSATDRTLALHSCDEPSCVNPSHLYRGDAQRNSNDAVSRGRMRRGSKHGRALLSEDDAMAILVWNCRGVTPSALAKSYSVAVATIHRITRRTGWKHLHFSPGEYTDFDFTSAYLQEQK